MQSNLQSLRQHQKQNLPLKRDGIPERGEGMRCGTDRNIRCKLYPQRFILVLSGTLPVIQQMSSTTHEILITIRFSSTKHPALIHMDMIYTWHSPSPSKLYIYHFRLRLRPRRYIMSYSPPGTSRGQILWHNYFHCQSVAIFLRNYVLLFIFFSVAWFWLHQASRIYQSSPPEVQRLQYQTILGSNFKQVDVIHLYWNQAQLDF